MSAAPNTPPYLALPAAYLLIEDMQTSVYVYLQQPDAGYETDLYGNIYSPPPKTETVSYKRAMIHHQIPQLKYDVIQDMEQESPVIKMSGIGSLAVKTQLEAWIALPQLGSWTNGRFNLSMYDRQRNLLWQFNSVVMENFQYTPIAGTPRWFTISFDVSLPNNQ